MYIKITDKSDALHVRSGERMKRIHPDSWRVSEAKPTVSKALGVLQTKEPSSLSIDGWREDLLLPASLSRCKAGLW